MFAPPWGSTLPDPRTGESQLLGYWRRMPSRRCVRVWRACETNYKGKILELRALIGAVICLRVSRQYTVGRMKWCGYGQKGKHWPNDNGFQQYGRCERIQRRCLLLARLNIELRAGSGLHYGDRLPLLGRCGSALSCLRLDMLLLHFLLKDEHFLLLFSRIIDPDDRKP